MDPYLDGEDRAAAGGFRRPASARWPLQLLIGVLTALVVWPLAAWDSGDEPIKATVAGETLERLAAEPNPTPEADTTVAAESTTSTTAAPAAPPPTTVPPPPTTATTAPPRPTPTTTAPPPPTTTTTHPKAPKPIRRQVTSQVFAGVQLTLIAAPPASGQPRTASFEVTAEFGDTRVLRSLEIDFGDGSRAVVDVVPWACWDPAAPNPYVAAGPTHTYANPGNYQVVVTARTALCVPGSPEPVSEDTAHLPLALAVG